MVFSLKTLACLQHRLLVLQNAFLMTVVRLASMPGRHLAFKKVTAAYTHGNRHDAFCIVHVTSTQKNQRVCVFHVSHYVMQVHLVSRGDEKTSDKLPNVSYPRHYGATKYETKIKYPNMKVGKLFCMK